MYEELILIPTGCLVDVRTCAIHGRLTAQLSAQSLEDLNSLFFTLSTCLVVVMMLSQPSCFACINPGHNPAVQSVHMYDSEKKLHT